MAIPLQVGKSLENLVSLSKLKLLVCNITIKRIKRETLIPIQSPNRHASVGVFQTLSAVFLKYDLRSLLSYYKIFFQTLIKKFRIFQFRKITQFYIKLRNVIEYSDQITLFYVILRNFLIFFKVKFSVFFNFLTSKIIKFYVILPLPDEKSSVWVFTKYYVISCNLR